MHLPLNMPVIKRGQDSVKPRTGEYGESVQSNVGGKLSPAGCCAQVCAPFVGCHCVLENPLCP